MIASDPPTRGAIFAQREIESRKISDTAPSERFQLRKISNTEHAIIEIAHNSGEDCKAAIEKNVWTQAWGEDLRASILYREGKEPVKV